MARKVKFTVAASSLLAVSALILLSAGPADCVQCYWCGPLAEQVHRSERAPSCDAALNVTDCDPAYKYCAVVASTPPYAESRYCIEFYRDDCFAFYCNATKTSRVMCPCRGELCNGKTTQREIDAFAVLTTPVTKTQDDLRIKKRNAIFSDNLAKSNKDRMASLIQNDDVENMTNTEATSDENESAVENEITEHIKVSDLSDVDSTMQADQASIEEPKNDNTEVASHEGNESPSMMMPTTQIPQSETQKDNKQSEMTTYTKAIAERNEADAMKATESTMGLAQTRNVETNSFISNDIKPNMELPTAEALQQKSGPITSEKSVEQTSDSTVVTTPQSATILVASTASTTYSASNKPTEPTRNSGVEVSACMIVLFNSIAINTII